MRSSSEQMPGLLVHRPDGTVRRHPLSARPLVIGRALSCDIVLRDDGGVSREHAQVWLDADGRVNVEDRGSKNGTRVDGGEAFWSATRHAAHSIRLGDYELELLNIAPPPARDATPVTAVRFAPETAATVGDTRYFPSTQGLDLNQQRLALLISLTERIGGAFERKQLLEQALDACCEALHFERGLIALKAKRGEPEMPVTRNIQQDETGAYKVSRTLINQALLHGQRAVVNNPATDLADNLTESLLRFPICSALCVPILHRDEILGVIYGDRITQGSTYVPEDVDFLAAIAQQVGTGLANLRLFQEYLRAQKVYHELEQARDIQQRLLPAAPLELGRARIVGHNEPSSAVGGDYFDYFPLDEHHVGFIIADVTGHGLAAALVMANLQAAVRVALVSDISLAEVGARLNRLILDNTDVGVFVTGIVGCLDTQSGHLRYISAGHPGPLMFRPAAVKPLEPDTSLPFGVEEDEDYHVQELTADPELQALLFYTDGLVEAEAADGDMLGVERLVEQLTPLKSQAADDILAATLTTVRTHVSRARLTDDMTLLAIAFR